MNEPEMDALLRELHDAILSSVEFDWKGGRTVAVVKAIAMDRILVHETTSFECTRAMPWGPSAAINAIAMERVLDGVVLRIQMQSGDMIVIRGSSVSLEMAAP